jgi:hypothetical protein
LIPSTMHLCTSNGVFKDCEDLLQKEVGTNEMWWVGL